MKENLLKITKELKSLKNIKGQLSVQPNHLYKIMKPPSQMTMHEKRSIKDNIAKSTLLSKFSGSIPEFQSDSLKNYGCQSSHQKGAFGEVSLCKITFMGVICAKKVINGSSTDLKSEACAMLQLSGHPCFPFFYGIMKPGALLMEYISPSANAIMTSKSLNSIVKGSTLKTRQWFKICRELIKGLSHMHSKGLLHNDLHGNNILIRFDNSPCIIDFGKATLMEHPIVYNIVKGSKESLRYNKIHQHLAYELRNQPNTPQSYLTDIYSLGYNFKAIATHSHIEPIMKLSKRMMCVPLERYTLEDCSVFLLKE